MSAPVSDESNNDNPTEQSIPDEIKRGDDAAAAPTTRGNARFERLAPELDALLREEESRLRRSRSQRRRRLRERAKPAEVIRFAGDISTPNAWLAATDKLIRRFAAGKIGYRQFDAMLKMLKLVARERSVCSSRLLRIPRLPSVSAGFVIEADLRSRSARKADLLRLSLDARDRTAKR